MRTNQERLEFAVKLAQTNLSELRQGDLLNLREDFVAFFAAGGILIPGREILKPTSEPLPGNYTVTDFEALQKEVYSIFTEIVRGKEVPIEATILPKEAGVSISGGSWQPTRTITVKLTAESFIGDRSLLIAEGSTRDCFLLRLFLILAQEPVTRIMRCRASDCNRIFYRKKKQEYCSTRCTNRDYMKTYRKDQSASPAAAAVASEKNHERYKKRIKKAVRPRKKKTSR